jgi:hypothetical protein
MQSDGNAALQSAKFKRLGDFGIKNAAGRSDFQLTKFLRDLGDRFKPTCLTAFRKQRRRRLSIFGKVRC